ncbi:MAG: ribonuclease J [Firmicutes bacterium]|nr:ribonuclease J [Bacillota bacterium]
MGGIGEIGKNMTALSWGNDMIVIDCGLSFPDGDLPGIDLVIPDTAYLKENESKLRGIFATHGHEDHIGALPFVLKNLKNVPVYGSNITLALAEHKLREHNVQNAKTVTVKAGDVVKAGVFTVEFIRVSHSVAGSFALSVTTPAGVVFHTGDFKIDYSPLKGEMTDLNRISEIGRGGVLLLLAESTNIERPGYTMSETKVAEALDRIIMDNAGRRIFIATFSSNIHRIQQIIDLAQKYNRRVSFSGRSMLNVMEIAVKIGELRYDRDNLIDVERIEKAGERNVVVITTGSQGEPMSALTRMAGGDFNKINIGENDTIVISASPIPGNEKMIYNVINNLTRRGARAIYESLADVHVSGHACQEELKLIHSLVKPKFFIPVHGEYRHLKQHVDLCGRLGFNTDNTFIPDNGNCVELTPTSMRRGADVTAGEVLVDGASVGDIGEEVLRDRRRLAADGVLVVIVGVNPYNGKISGPEIVARGFMPAGAAELTTEAKALVREAVANGELDLHGDLNAAKDRMRKILKDFIFRKMKQSPMILPVIVEN